MTPKDDASGIGSLLRDSSGWWSFGGYLGSAWNDFRNCGCFREDPMRRKQLIIAKTSKEKLDCLEICQDRVNF